MDASTSSGSLATTVKNCIPCSTSAVRDNRVVKPPTSTQGSELLQPEILTADITSRKGQFGWTMVGEEPIPFIQRGRDRFLAVRMVEVGAINKYLRYLNKDVYSSITIKSYFVTDVEARLLNEINIRHCDLKYGRALYTTKDLIVGITDAQKFHDYLEFCYNKLFGRQIPEDPEVNNKQCCGFIKINKDSVIPFIEINEIRYVPIFYFEGELDKLTLQAQTLHKWDLAYLTFCFKVQGIRTELFSNEKCPVTRFELIKELLPLDTIFDDYWPLNVVDNRLLIPEENDRSWTKVPPGLSMRSLESSSKPPEHTSIQVSNAAILNSSQPYIQRKQYYKTTSQHYKPCTSQYSQPISRHSQYSNVSAVLKEKKTGNQMGSKVAFNRSNDAGQGYLIKNNNAVQYYVLANNAAAGTYVPPSTRAVPPLNELHCSSSSFN